MRAMNIKERVKRIIAQQRQQLEKEVEFYEEKMRDTESYWGFGGAYSRQEAAAERRKQQLEELDDFEQQLKYVTKHQTVRMYVFGCSSCGSVTMVTRQPFDQWHECPVCRSMIYLEKMKDKTFRVEDTGESWMDTLRKCAEVADDC